MLPGRHREVAPLCSTVAPRLKTLHPCLPCVGHQVYIKATQTKKGASTTPCELAAAAVLSVCTAHIIQRCAGAGTAVEYVCECLQPAASVLCATQLQRTLFAQIIHHILIDYTVCSLGAAHLNGCTSLVHIKVLQLQRFFPAD